MNPEIKAQWVAALRSGEYEQGRNKLNTDGKYCCLGVLCELAHLAGGIVNKDSASTIVYYDDESSLLPGSVKKWAGLHSNNPYIDAGDDYCAVALLNDGGCEADDNTHIKPRTFTQIADLIEAQL